MADERRALGELGALVAAAAHRRPELPVVLAGGMGAELGAFGDVADRLGRVLVGPAAHAGPDGDDLRDLLTDLALPADDARRALGAVALTLAELLDRRVDIVEIGFDGGTTGWRVAGAESGSRAWTSRSCQPPGLLPPIPTTGWSIASPRGQPVQPIDTGCATDCGSCGSRRWPTRRAMASRCEWPPRGPRLAVWRNGRRNGPNDPRPISSWPPVVPGRSCPRRPSHWPWSTCSGAPGRPSSHSIMPGCLRPSASIADPRERRAILADLADDLLAPLGTVVTPGGLRHGRSAGALHLHGANGAGAARPLDRGTSSLSICRPGHSAVAEFQFHDTVRLGGRGRHFAIDVTGGLGGLLVDLRDVPLRLPDRADLRSEAARGLAGGRRGRERRVTTATSDVRARCRRRPLVVIAGGRRLPVGAGRPGLVAAGRFGRVGAPIAERVRDPSLEEVHVAATPEPVPGGRWSSPAEGRAGTARGR